MPTDVAKDSQTPATGGTPATGQQIFLQKFAAGPLNYWISFTSDSIAAVFFLAWGIQNGPGHVISAALCFIVGFLLWGVSEYAFHRWLYHQPHGVFGAGHTLHHESEKAYFAMPWFISAGAVFGAWYLATHVMHIPGFSEFLAGWMTGFILYSWVHHAHHHWVPRNAWMRRMTAHHRIHHRFPDTNFGVTMRMWDDVFGTRFRDAGTAKRWPGLEIFKGRALVSRVMKSRAPQL
jgi:sterol desaturase/sphingolipid hydroxylase (fatty acid hydroxylase superfamily)